MKCLWHLFKSTWSHFEELEKGKARGRIASLIETSKINGVEPFAYLDRASDAPPGTTVIWRGFSPLPTSSRGPASRLCRQTLMGNCKIQTPLTEREHPWKKIGMKNLAYNMRCLVQLRRINPCPA